MRAMEGSRRNRAFMPKVRTGCLTCKKRKVKCDEAKPECHRCVSSGRECGGYTEPAISQRTSPARVTPPLQDGVSAWLDSLPEKRSFHFFLEHAGPRLGGYFQTPFWAREVLQTAVRYPAIRHLVVAIGAAYEDFESKPLPDGIHSRAKSVEGIGKLALQQCNQAIRAMRRSPSPSDDEHDESLSTTIETMYCTITMATLFTAFTALQGQFEQCIEHLRSGLRVVRALEDLLKRERVEEVPAAGGGAGAGAGAFPIPLKRLRLVLTSYYAQARAMMNSEARTFASWDADPLVSPLDPEPVFVSLADAQENAEALLANQLAFHQGVWLRPVTTPEGLADARARFGALSRALAASRAALTALVERRGGDPNLVCGEATEKDMRSVRVIRLYHTMIGVRLKVDAPHEGQTREEREVAFDGARPELARMLELIKVIVAADDKEFMKASSASSSKSGRGAADAAGSEKLRRPVCTSGLGIVMPLHMVAARCRDTKLRKEALRMLMQIQRREGLWDSTLAGHITAQTIAVEEAQRQALGQESEDGVAKIPGDKRVRETKIYFDGERGARLVFVTAEQAKKEQADSATTSIRW